MRCPACGDDDDKVVDSRASDDATAIRRRRECLSCRRRFTTFERIEEAPLTILKRGGVVQPFDRQKVEVGVSLAAKGRSIDGAAVEQLVDQVEEELRLSGGEVPSEAVGRAVLERLADLDGVAALRFASVYKGFDDISDFTDEINELAKRTAPKS
ncbi:MAG TPA: transcriptional regulator NrdR [Acidimicrobiales bacterium]|nr:transcriptional regulator NrdR [Acidimicrobiales bacterium]